MLDSTASNLLFHKQCKNKRLFSVRNFLSFPQAATWVEAVLVLQGGVQQLATIMEAVSSLKRSHDDDSRFVFKWFEDLRRVIFTWGGTLGETPSEIHHLYLLDLFPRRDIFRTEN